MTESTVLEERHGAIAVVRLNRPQARNAISDDMQAALLDLLDALDAATDVAGVVLTGQPPAFCAGGDIRGMQQRLGGAPDEVAAVGWRRLRGTQRLASRLHGMSKVTIAAVNGPAYGIGMDLALCCDLVCAGSSAVFAMSYVKVGLVPDGGGMSLLPQRVGLSVAKELIYSGRSVNAEEAFRLGIADRLYADEELDSGVLAWMEELTAHSATATALAKGILDRSGEVSFETVLQRSADAQAACYTSREHRAAVERFLDHRSRSMRSES